MAYNIDYMPTALEHLRSLSARARGTVMVTVEEQLRLQPEVPTRNRKRLRANRVAPWELRIGDLRVFYDIEPAAPVSPGDEAEASTVVILAVGAKKGNRLWLGNEECEL